MRKQLFRDIVEEQDKGGPPDAARARAAARFGVTEREARLVESEGMAAAGRGLTPGPDRRSGAAGNQPKATNAPGAGCAGVALLLVAGAVGGVVMLAC